MRTFKLWVHQKTSFNGSEVVINPKELPEVRIGDIIEIYHPEDDNSRLLLQVTSHLEDFQQKETVSVEQSIASSFQLRTYQDVVVNVVPKQNVALDLVELCFKDQYFSRSDMWRLSNTLCGTCVYQNKKIAFSEMRAIVNEIWAKGERMTCGYITEDTRVVYRSSTAVINIFIQMSCEMWEFDAVGDLYFEKAMEFLKALFAKWSEKNCCHDVTIVMFSRTFYSAVSREDFPLHMKDTIQEDYMGRFYEDFYRVVVQNERFDEWTSIIIELKQIFVSYREKVLNFHHHSGHESLDSYNSTAAQGNFLEVINMSLNVYENFNIDRNFDRTGKIAMVITPGAGVFEVNRELTNVTKQRTIDNGIGMDIVCMAEQPLHVVPLFKFHSKSDALSFEVGDDYNLPHWINISFYQSASQIQAQNSSAFVPRIKFGLKTRRSATREMPLTSPNWNLLGENKSDNFPFLDYEEYDAQVFKLPKTLGSVRRGNRSASTSKSRTPQTFSEALSKKNSRVRTVSDDFHGLAIGRRVEPVSPARSAKLASDDSTISMDTVRSISQESLLDSEDSSSSRFIVGSDSSVGNKFVRSRKSDSHISNARPSRALINPFAPARMNFKVTSNRRRWIHAFPMDPKGATIRQHCYIEKDQEDKTERQLAPNVIEAAQIAVEMRKQRTRLESGSENDPRNSPTLTSNSSSSTTIGVGITNTSNTSLSALGKSTSTAVGSAGTRDTPEPASYGSRTKRAGKKRLPPMRKELDMKSGGWFFGPTGDGEWSPSLTLGVDWKSLCIPAHLPITTDYFPDDETLKKFCLFPAYSLGDDIFPEISDKRKNDTSAQIFKELLSQRLAQGFQLIKEDRITVPVVQAPPTRYGQRNVEVTQEYKMSIGRIFHRLTFNGKTIEVTRYNPMHPATPIRINYRYRLQVPDAEVYEPCITAFANQQLEQFNWNYLDHYICSAGEGDEYGLVPSFKFWRSRFFLLPAVNSATKKIIEGSERCDIYEEMKDEEIDQLYSGFLRFMEALNKIRRPAPTRKPKPRKVCVPSPKKPTHAQDTSDIKPETKRVRHPSVPAKLHLSENPDISPIIAASVKPITSANEGRRPSQTAASLISHSNTDVSMLGPADSSKSPSSENVFTTLNVNSTLQDIVSALQDSVEGISFLPSQGLPAQCFVASEAVVWVECCVEGICNDDHAIHLLQRMVDARLICHSSGNFKHPFVNGFVLYNIVNDRQMEGKPSSYGHRQMQEKLFHDDWCEVALDKRTGMKEGSVPTFLFSNLEVANLHIWSSVCSQKENYRQVNVDVDTSNKSDRKEWAVAQYHTKYNPSSPFSIEIQWMVATGCILGDLIYTYFRKASSCGYHLLPVPVDQFSLPQSDLADPLRVPVFIPLKINCLKNSEKEGLFDEFGPDPLNHLRRLQLFQHAILKRFGFLHDAYSVNSSTSHGLKQDIPFKYVHCSGSVFVLIPDYQERKLAALQAGNKHRRYSVHLDFVTRRGSYDHSQQHAGFLWAWNFMLSRRWRSSNTGDEAFQDKMLADFRKFCSNDENRLRDFWDECWAKLRKKTVVFESLQNDDNETE